MYPHESAVVVAVGEQLRTFHQLTVMAKPVLWLRDGGLRLAAEFGTEELRSPSPMRLLAGRLLPSLRVLLGFVMDLIKHR